MDADARDTLLLHNDRRQGGVGGKFFELFEARKERRLPPPLLRLI